jgi:hypothetical protein
MKKKRRLCKGKEEALGHDYTSTSACFEKTGGAAPFLVTW